MNVAIVRMVNGDTVSLEGELVSRLYEHFHSEQNSLLTWVSDPNVSVNLVHAVSIQFKGDFKEE